MGMREKCAEGKGMEETIMSNILVPKKWICWLRIWGGIVILFFVLVAFWDTSIVACAASLEEYDLDSLDSYVEDTLYQHDFKTLTESLMTGTLDGEGILGKCIEYFRTEIKRCTKTLFLVLGTILLGAVFKNVTEILNNASVIKTGSLITYFAVMILLFSTFGQCFDQVQKTMGQIMEFLYALIPTFFCAVSFSQGSFSGTILYQWTGLCISVMQASLKHLFLPLVKYYVILSVVNGATNDGKFGMFCRFIKKLIQYSNRALIGMILGMTSIKSLTAPLADEVKNNMIKKTISLVPGIGNGVEGVAQTLESTGNLIKNSIGMAGLLIVALLLLYPLIRLVLMNLIFHFLSAVAEPVAEKSIIRGIVAMVDGFGILQYLMLSSGLILMISIGIICMVTGVR